MRISPLQVSHRLYAQGFGSDDPLQRKEAGRRLSDLLEKVHEPIVVALDGRWGSGKSHFLKRWVGAHTLENGGTATTVYFDAFSSDFLDDPLVALTSAIGERLTTPLERSKWEKAKQAVAKLARPFFRVGLTVATAGLTELAAPVVDAAIQAGSGEAEKAAEAFWRREDGRRAAMETFRDYLVQLTETVDGGVSERKSLVVVVDELDRCRPDYALTVLEVVKHFFSVPYVHFVLGVNLDALEHMVRSRYGSGIDAHDYLKRFISVTMTLPGLTNEATSTEAKYFRLIAADMGIPEQLLNDVSEQLKLTYSGSQYSLTLRDMERVLARLVLLPNRLELGSHLPGWRILIAGLTIMQVAEPALYRSALSGDLAIEHIDAFYGIRPSMLDEGSPSYSHPAYITRGVWQFALTAGTLPHKDRESFSKLFDRFGTRNPENIIPVLQRDFFSLFEVAE